MKDRIKQIMEHEGLSSTKFAETIGINRSAMSHYMTGRNDPGVDVLRKIYERFPHLRLEWLLTGNGSMTVEKLAATSENIGIKHNANTQLDIFVDSPPSPVEKISPPPVKPIIATQQEVLQPPEYRPEIRMQTHRNISRQSVYETIQQKKEVKSVTKIMLFYSDDTFETFIPEKSRKDKS
ncbi:MAG: helix-turn-helix domain-containing protein [Tannerellaceae bacterium]|jgi:transcriptional regulator with XRE-family HTH domain|nr:helix-turn-helix domain-containing protein [Tannerellaceae bacterium]